MRVISGCARGHNLKTIEGLDTRPTLDRIKETLFNMICEYIPECEFLDLFAGSGAIGIEALSRGASNCVFIDSNPKCCDIINFNLNHTKLYDKAQVIKGDIFENINKLSDQNRKFDVIFMDPPYEGGFDKSVPEAIVKAGLLKKQGLLIAERAAKYDLPQISGLKIKKEKSFGKTTAMAFFVLED